MLVRHLAPGAVARARGPLQVLSTWPSSPCWPSSSPTRSTASRADRRAARRVGAVHAGDAGVRAITAGSSRDAPRIGVPAVGFPARNVGIATLIATAVVGQVAMASFVACCSRPRSPCWCARLVDAPAGQACWRRNADRLGFAPASSLRRQRLRVSELALAPGSFALRRICRRDAAGRSAGRGTDAVARVGCRADSCPGTRRLLVGRSVRPRAPTPLRVAPCFWARAQGIGCSHFGLLLGSRWRLEHMACRGAGGELRDRGRALETFTVLHWLNASGGVAYSGAGRVTTLGYAVFEPGSPTLDANLRLHVAIGVAMLRQLSGNSSWAPSVVRLARVRHPTRDPTSTSSGRRSIRRRSEHARFPDGVRALRVPVPTRPKRELERVLASVPRKQ